jgi:hypothetical protein
MKDKTNKIKNSTNVIRALKPIIISRLPGWLPPPGPPNPPKPPRNREVS